MMHDVALFSYLFSAIPALHVGWRQSFKVRIKKILSPPKQMQNK
jgi:hypothetical protein